MPALTSCLSISRMTSLFNKMVDISVSIKPFLNHTFHTVSVVEHGLLGFYLGSLESHFLFKSANNTSPSTFVMAVHLWFLTHTNLVIGSSLWHYQYCVSAAVAILHTALLNLKPTPTFLLLIFSLTTITGSNYTLCDYSLHFCLFVHSTLSRLKAKMERLLHSFL